MVLIGDPELDLTRRPLLFYAGVMFNAYCPGHGGRVHLGPDSIVAFGNAGSGMLVRWSVLVRHVRIGAVRGRHTSPPLTAALAVRFRHLS